jgi:hypothetical protein
MRRIKSAALIAVPLSFISSSFAGYSKTPILVRYLLAPGYVFSVFFRSSFYFFLVLALVIDALYYTLIVFLISSSVDSISESQTTLRPIWWRILMGLWLIYTNVKDYVQPAVGPFMPANEAQPNGANAAALGLFLLGCWLAYSGIKPVWNKTASHSA